MKFTFNGTSYSIWFKYTHFDGKRETVCIIDTPDKQTFAAGSALCAHGDRFVKATGRSIALERALLDAIKRKGQTHEFWKAAMKAFNNRAVAQRKEVAA